MNCKKILARQTVIDRRRLTLAVGCWLGASGFPLPATAGDGDDRSVLSRAYDRMRRILSPEPSEGADLPAVPLAHNDANQVIDDMARRNDAPLRGFEKFKSGWYVGPGHTMLGNDPRLKNGGQWFLESYGTRFDVDRRMTAIMPWVVVADGERHSAQRTRVQLANVRLFLLQKSTNRWVSLGSSRGVRGDFYFKPELARSSGKRDLAVNDDGSVEIGFPESRDQVFHGWWTKGRLEIPVNPADIKAVFVSMQARLAPDHDRRQSSDVQLLMQVGADYYFSKDSTWNGVPAPAVVSSRLKLIKPDWQTISAMTFNDVGRSDPPGERGISRAEFERNPPPFH
jgi:hypothetical protein